MGNKFKITTDISLLFIRTTFRAYFYWEAKLTTDMDEQGRNFAKIIATKIEPIECSTPIYDAKDPAELLLKIQSNEQK